MQKEVYTHMSATVTIAFLENWSQGKIWMICSISFIDFSVDFIPFLIYLQHWHHPPQSNFPHIWIWIITCIAIWTVASLNSIFYSCHFVTLLGYLHLLPFCLWFWAHHAVLIALPLHTPPQASQIFLFSGSREVPEGLALLQQFQRARARVTEETALKVTMVPSGFGYQFVIRNNIVTILQLPTFVVAHSLVLHLSAGHDECC